MVELENFRYKSNVGNLFLNIACDLYYNNLLPHIYVKKCWDKYNKTKNGFIYKIIFALSNVLRH